MKSITIGKSDAGDVKVDVAQLLASRAFIQANSGGGKSWLLRLLAEKLMPGYQVIVIDKEGEFATLREKHDLLLVGSGGEVPADPRSAAVLARKLAELGVSAVLDIYDLHPPEQRRFVRLFCEGLVEIPKNLYHPMFVFLDEAHIFCPEKGSGEAESTAAVISLLSLGRKRGICTIPATQRLSKLHKDAEAECNNVFIGRTVQDIDQERAGKVLGFKGNDRLQLRDNDPGQFFGFGPALLSPGITKFTAGDVETSHPKAGHHHQIKAPKASDAVKKLLAGLADLPKQAEEEAKTLADAKRRILALERDLRAAGKPKSVEVASKQDLVKIKNLRKGLEDAMKVIAQITAVGFEKTSVDPEQIKKAIDVAASQIVKMVESDISRRSAAMERLKSEASQLLGRLQKLLAEDSTVTVNVKHNEPFSVTSNPPPPRARAERPAGDGDSLPEGERNILQAAAMYEGGVERDQISVLTGYRRSSRDTYIQRLRSRGLIEVSGTRVIGTPAGIAALGPSFEPLPTGPALQEYWIHQLPEGERKILEVLIASYPDAISREKLDEATGYKRSSRDTYIQRLSSRRLVETVGRGEVRASKDLF